MAQDTASQHQAAVIAAELDEIREELKRLDGKARDLLLVATFLVTATVAAVSLIRTGIPVPLRVIALIALTPWAWSIVELLLVIRPVLVQADDTGEPDEGESNSVDLWRQRRRSALNDIRTRKTRRIRRAVDGLIVVLILVLTGGILLATVF
jgi:hypothetical protein